MENTKQAAPKLQAPGAGLPLYQRIFLKAFVGPFVSKKVPPEVSRAQYEKLVSKTIALASKVSPEKRSIQILVDPIRGLEDSSRFWSINGTLEHLMIVGRNIENTILSLASGKDPNINVDIAKVKPTHMSQDFLAEYQSYAPDLMKRLDEKLSTPGFDLNSKLTLTHPWFGPFTARQWYWLLNGHQGIHYQQIKGIIKGLE